jgi:hypothetical protein
VNYWFLYQTSDGSISGNPYLGQTDTFTNVPSGCAVLGPIADTDTSAQDAWKNPHNYAVLNGTLVMTATSTQQFQQAQQAQMVSLAAKLESVLGAGFQSDPSATGTASTFGFADADQRHWSWLQGLINTANQGDTTAQSKFPVQVKDIKGNRMQLTLVQATTLVNDAQSFYLTNYMHWDGKEQDVQNIQLSSYSTLQDAVNAVNGVTW